MLFYLCNYLDILIVAGYVIVYMYGHWPVASLKRTDQGKGCGKDIKQESCRKKKNKKLFVSLRTKEFSI